jgi:RNA polymerase sigma-70 factor (ECF subfamily)
MTDAASDLAVFEQHRPRLFALAYRMLGDVGRAEDVVQEAWLRFHRKAHEVEAPRAFLVTIVTRLCLNELESARARREDTRDNRLPEPIDLDEGGIAKVERLDQVSMAFLVVLQRLSPAERAVFLLHDVFDFPHDEIARLVRRSAAACRKLLERARAELAAGKRVLRTSRDEHERLLSAFVRAASAGDVAGLLTVLAPDATLISDPGPEGRVVGAVRSLDHPLAGASRVAAFIAATSRIGGLSTERRELNGQPAVVFFRQGEPFAALLLGVADGKIQQIFFHADPARLRCLDRQRRS